MGGTVRKRITEKNINKIANEFCSTLLTIPDDTYMPVSEMAEELDLTESQVQRVCKYIRDCAYGVQFDKFMPFYVISSKSGYSLLKKMSDENIVKCYKTLTSWANSVNRTLYPLKEYIRINEIPIEIVDEDEFDRSVMDDFMLMNTDGATAAWKE